MIMSTPGRRLHVRYPTRLLVPMRAVITQIKKRAVITQIKKENISFIFKDVETNPASWQLNGRLSLFALCIDSLSQCLKSSVRPIDPYDTLLSILTGIIQSFCQSQYLETM